MNNSIYRQNSSSSLSSNSSYSSPTMMDNQWDDSSNKYHPYRHKKRSSKKGVSTFISKLFSMVSERSNQHLISWNPNGTSFFVYNATKFSKKVLPEFFKHSNFSSFVRQLNMYGFHKINKSPRGQRGNNENEIWEFSHPNFIMNRPDLLEDIKRKSMDSELLRRETSDIHASFAMVQLSQADVIEQFRVLQENFANLLNSFQDMKKIQLQQQYILKKLAEHEAKPSVIITSPLDQGMMLQDNLTPNHFQLNTLPPSPCSTILLDEHQQNQHKRLSLQSHGISLS